MIQFRLDGKEVRGRATHTDYLHPAHLRVEMADERILCMAPNAQAYSKINRKGLPVWKTV